MMDYRTAIEKFNLALGIDPNMSNALFALGMCYKNLNEFDEAIQIFERVMNIDAGNKMSLFEIKQIEKLKGMDSSTT
jgi:tetratricopeptide (TPR) repeat protein